MRVGAKSPQTPTAALAAPGAGVAPTPAREAKLTAKDMLLVETTAMRVIELLRDSDEALCDDVRPSDGMVDASTLAAQLGLKPAWIREHATELGGARLGTGPKAPHRFDPDVARAQIAAMRSCASMQSQADTPNAAGGSEPPRTRRRRRMPNGLPPAGAILASRPQKAAR